MKFVIGEARTEVSLTLDKCEEGYHKDTIFLRANGLPLMGFRNGKYRLFSDASAIDGLETKGCFIVCENYP